MPVAPSPLHGRYPVTLASLTWSSGSLYTGVVTCLSCHDGNVSKGAMMSGQAYEQSFGLLNFATNVGSNRQAAQVSLYGTSRSRPCSATTAAWLATTPTITQLAPQPTWATSSAATWPKV